MYGYDEKNLLAYAAVGDTVSQYEIGTDGLRVGKTVGNESTAYTIDQDGNVILENGDDIIRGHQALAKRTEDGSYYYYIYNGHGDVVMLVDESGNVKNSYQYDAWGKITNETETIPNSIKYAGEYYDAETGFLYYCDIIGQRLEKPSKIKGLTDLCPIFLCLFLKANMLF